MQTNVRNETKTSLFKVTLLSDADVPVRFGAQQRAKYIEDTAWRGEDMNSMFKWHFSCLKVGKGRLLSYVEKSFF